MVIHRDRSAPLPKEWLITLENPSHVGRRGISCHILGKITQNCRFITSQGHRIPWPTRAEAPGQNPSESRSLFCHLTSSCSVAHLEMLLLWPCLPSVTRRCPPCPQHLRVRLWHCQKWSGGLERRREGGLRSGGQVCEDKVFLQEEDGVIACHLCLLHRHQPPENPQAGWRRNQATGGSHHRVLLA